MNRYTLLSVAALFVAAATPCQAQFLQDLKDQFLGGGGAAAGQYQQQPQIIGNVSLPPGTYMMSNVQTGQAFYVAVQNGQMALVPQPGVAPNTVAPTTGGLGGALGGLLSPQQPQQQLYGQPQPQQGNGLGGLVRSGLTNFLQNQMTGGQQPVMQPGQ